MRRELMLAVEPALFPGIAGHDRLRDAVLPGADLRPRGRIRSARSSGDRLRGGTARAHGIENTGPGEHRRQRRRAALGGALLDRAASRARCSSPRRSRASGGCIPTTRACSSSATATGSSSPSRSPTCRARGTRSRRRLRRTVPPGARTRCAPSRPTRPRGRPPRSPLPDDARRPAPWSPGRMTSDAPEAHGGPPGPRRRRPHAGRPAPARPAPGAGRRAALPVLRAGARGRPSRRPRLGRRHRGGPRSPRHAWAGGGPDQRGGPRRGRPGGARRPRDRRGGRLHAAGAPGAVGPPRPPEPAGAPRRAGDRGGARRGVAARRPRASAARPSSDGGVASAERLGEALDHEVDADGHGDGEADAPRVGARSHASKARTAAAVRCGATRYPASGISTSANMITLKSTTRATSAAGPCWSVAICLSAARYQIPGRFRTRPTAKASVIEPRASVRCRREPPATPVAAADARRGRGRGRRATRPVPIAHAASRVSSPATRSTPALAGEPGSLEASVQEEQQRQPGGEAHGHPARVEGRELAPGLGLRQDHDHPGEERRVERRADRQREDVRHVRRPLALRAGGVREALDRRWPRRSRRRRGPGCSPPRATTAGP